jgi:hypothetical protein
MTIRTRFAPSPTGYLHIGGVWAALFAWMYARRHGGQFILRIEDTDTKRTVPGALENLIASLRWFGLDWDEGPDVGGPHGPYIQTERAEIYTRSGPTGWWSKATPTNALPRPKNWPKCARNWKPKGTAPAMTGATGTMPQAEVEKLEQEGRPFTIRFKMPLDGQTVVPDLLRGDVVFDNDQFTDYVIVKSNGLPTYHLAHVVDDHLMQISHITRGIEWLNTAPIHVRFYEAFGWEMPVLVHMPVILSPSGKGKLSKRDQAFEEGGERSGAGRRVHGRRLSYPKRSSTSWPTLAGPLAMTRRSSPSRRPSPALTWPMSAPCPPSCPTASWTGSTVNTFRRWSRWRWRRPLSPTWSGKATYRRGPTGAGHARHACPPEAADRCH